ncbi:MAG: LytTR family transcriptional regulator [Tannerellaceae bacterium]|jgi:DNA-binding LytR/AlgR family response regulator|nr:LytTR family transcriptional regulator [Tannerellaceae bacterium]
MIKLNILDILAIHPDIVYIVGMNGVCFVFLIDHKIKYLRESMKNIESMLKDKDFIRINYHIIINSKFYVRNHLGGKKEIVMKNGIVLKVSRRRWINFK